MIHRFLIESLDITNDKQLDLPYPKIGCFSLIYTHNTPMYKFIHHINILCSEIQIFAWELNYLHLLYENEKHHFINIGSR